MKLFTPLHPEVAGDLSERSGPVAFRHKRAGLIASDLLERVNGRLLHGSGIVLAFCDQPERRVGLWLKGIYGTGPRPSSRPEIFSSTVMPNTSQGMSGGCNIALAEAAAPARQRVFTG